jgi:hypothetical protein
MVRNLHLTNGNRQTPYKKNKTSRWDRSFACKEIVVATKKSLSCVTSLYTLALINESFDRKKRVRVSVTSVDRCDRNSYQNNFGNRYCKMS